MKLVFRWLALLFAVLGSDGVLAATRQSSLSSGTVTGGVSYSTYVPSKAFDGVSTQTTGRWLVQVGSLPAWVEYRLNANVGAAISEYRIVAGCDGTHDIPARFPKNFTLSGSNDDGATWTVINTQSNITWTSAGQTKAFSLAETAHYRAYRFVCPTNNGASDYLSISEIELWGEAEVYPPPQPVSAAADPTPTDGDTGVSFMPELSWHLDANALSADVYVGTNEVLGASDRVATGALCMAYDIGFVGTGKTVFWRVDTVGALGTATGAVWRFTTTTDPLPSEVLVEAESFTNAGGWVLDTMFVPLMGSPYLNAHGKGVPVVDATTTVYLDAGEYAVWVRTRDWTPDYAGDDKPGRFQVLVDGAALAPVFGIAPANWGWAAGGTFTTAGGGVNLALHDLTGFNGRCDAVYVTADLAAAAPPDSGLALEAWRSAKRGEGTVPDDGAAYDFVVVGGGIAGTAAAVAAAQQGLSVALIQDRDMLGGNASGEIRVKTQGVVRHSIVSAIRNTYDNGLPGAQICDTNRLNYVRGYANIALHTGWRAYGVTTNADGTIAAVDAQNMRTGTRKRFSAPLFADCTGDGWVGYWAGADYRMGREAASEFGESENTLNRVSGKTLIPAIADGVCLGSTLQWTTATGANATAFPAVPWALTVSGSRAETSGDWRWEAGIGADENTIYDAEMLRDRLLRAIYGNFYNAHVANPKLYFTWVPYVTGKRESRRLMGDHIITQSDVQNGAWFEDAVGTASWPIDLHFYVNGLNYKSECSQTTVSEWYYPYRALYSRNVNNLFMAGRDISCTHVAFGSLRVMNTCGQMGVAVGFAASLCKKYDCRPRDIYRQAAKTQELQLMIGGVWPDRDLAAPVVIDDGDCVYVDNASAQTSGAWTVSSSNAGRYGADYLHNNKVASPDLWVRFTPDLPSNGLYYVQGIWNGGADGGRASAVSIEIETADGVVTNTVDMGTNDGQWSLIGSFRFDTRLPHSVRILTVGCSGSYVIADAFRFAPAPEGVVYRDPQDYDGNGLPDDWERYYFLQAGGVDPNADPDGDGLVNRSEYVAGTDPLDAASTFSIRGMLNQAAQETGPHAIGLVWPSAEGRTYTILRADSLTGGFTVFRSGITATPPQNVESIDVDAATGFFKISVEN